MKNIYRGVQRKMIVLKNIGSELFDEAYFVIKESGENPMSEKDMVSEACRIVSEKLVVGKKRKKGGRIIRDFLTFSLGASISFLVTYICCLLFA